MPAADFVMQRNVPIRLTLMMRSKFSSGYSLGAPVVRSSDAVFWAPPPTPAQFTRMRSCPWAARAFANPASTSSVDVTLTLQKTPPISLARVSPCSALRSKIATFTP